MSGHDSIGGHHRGYRGHSDEWLTPPHIIEALGAFDLDPCVPETQPYPTATYTFTKKDDGLTMPWDGRVWLNPPYGPETGRWLSRLAGHGNGIALIFARTETKMFFEHVWDKATALVFIRGRIHFHHPDGTRAKANAGAPSVLVAYGNSNVASLRACGLGKFVGPDVRRAFTLFNKEDKELTQ